MTKKDFKAPAHALQSVRPVDGELHWTSQKEQWVGCVEVISEACKQDKRRVKRK